MEKCTKDTPCYDCMCYKSYHTGGKKWCMCGKYKEAMRMNEDINEMKRELMRLVRLREGAVGIDLKRTNYQIAELQNKIDHADYMEQIKEGKKDDVKILDFEELAEELGI